jgi:hypothetical protein
MTFLTFYKCKIITSLFTKCMLFKLLNFILKITKVLYYMLNSKLQIRKESIQERGARDPQVLPTLRIHNQGKQIPQIRNDLRP